MHLIQSYLTGNSTVNSQAVMLCNFRLWICGYWQEQEYACIIKDSPACRPKCTVSSQLQSPTWSLPWCQWAPAQRSVPSSYWAASVLPCGVWHHCGWLWLAWAWWSLWTRAAAHSSAGWERRGSVMWWSCCPLTSWGWHSWYSPHAGGVHLRHTHNSHLEKEISW